MAAFEEEGDISREKLDVLSVTVSLWLLGLGHTAGCWSLTATKITVHDEMAMSKCEKKGEQM